MKKKIRVCMPRGECHFPDEQHGGSWPWQITECEICLASICALIEGHTRWTLVCRHCYDSALTRPML